MSRHYPAVESPEVALNQAVAWALGRVGGHLRVDPAPAVGQPGWDRDDTEALLDDARRWHRVRSQDLIDPDEFLGRVVGGLFGARLDGIGGRLELAPSIPDGWRTMAARRLRAHRTLLDVELKPRAEWVTVRLAVMFGPPIAVAVGLPEAIRVTRVTADEIPLEGSRAIFTAADEHEVVLFLG